MSLRASGNRAINEAEAARQGLGAHPFLPVHDASLVMWSPKLSCSLRHMSLDAIKCNKTQHFWHFRGCCTVRRMLEGVAPATPRRVIAPDKPGG